MCYLLTFSNVNDREWHVLYHSFDQFCPSTTSWLVCEASTRRPAGFSVLHTWLTRASEHKAHRTKTTTLNKTQKQKTTRSPSNASQSIQERGSEPALPLAEAYSLPAVLFTGADSPPQSPGVFFGWADLLPGGYVTRGTQLRPRLGLLKKCNRAGERGQGTYFANVRQEHNISLIKKNWKSLENFPVFRLGHFWNN